MLHRGSRINLSPVERRRLVPKSCILVAARLQDGWDSSLVRLIRPTRHPQSHIRPGSGPEAYTDPELAQVGLTETEARAHGYAVGVLRSPFRENDRAQTARKTSGCVKVVTGK